MKNQETKFTPGPWQSYEQFNGRFYVGTRHVGPIGAGSHFVIADIMPHKMDKQGNARLIAAAPELFEALVGLLNPSEETEHYRQMAIDAIAKAR